MHRDFILTKSISRKLYQDFIVSLFNAIRNQFSFFFFKMLSCLTWLKRMTFGTFHMIICSSLPSTLFQYQRAHGILKMKTFGITLNISDNIKEDCSNVFYFIWLLLIMPISNTKLENAFTRDTKVYISLSMYVKHILEQIDQELCREIMKRFTLASLKASQEFVCENSCENLTQSLVL